MTTRILLLISFLLFTSHSVLFASTETDSLFAHIATLSEKEQADTLKRVIIKNIFKDPKKTFIYVRKFSTLPAVAKDSSLLCLTNYWTGMIYEMFGDYDTVRKGLDWFKQHFAAQYMVVLD